VSERKPDWRDDFEMLLWVALVLGLSWVVGTVVAIVGNALLPGVFP
jgi:hypothetical protein